MPFIAGAIILLVVLISGNIASQKQQNTSTSPSPTVSTTVPTATQTAVIQTPTPKEQLYKVVKVIDGDTIDVNVNEKTERIRLIGIDTPEIVDPRKAVQCFGKEASDKAKLLLTNQSVSLESDSTQGERDKYNRLLRYIFLKNGTSFNKLMISDGYAHEYTYNLPYKYQDEYKNAEKSARENKRGLWADNICVTPIPTIIPTSIPQPTRVPPTSVPYVPVYIPPTQMPQQVVPQTNSGGGFSCNCSKVCGAMASCEEAYYQLNTCGCSVRDGDHDGVPCETLCPGG